MNVLQICESDAAVAVLEGFRFPNRHGHWRRMLRHVMSTHAEIRLGKATMSVIYTQTTLQY